MLLVLLLAFFVLSVFAETACNGKVELCNRMYSNVSLIGSHDSAFVGPFPSDNQNLPVTRQLDFGIRFLQAQTHTNDFGTLDLCHTSCYLLDVGPLQSYLNTIKIWLDTHPNAVVTLLLTNDAKDPADISKFDDAFTKSGLKTYSYVPTSHPVAINAWPTLQSLIASGMRVVTFLDLGADITTVPYILDEFTYFFETPFDTTDPTFPDCKLDRPPNSSPEGKMYIVNHFLDVNLFGILIPDREDAGETNAASGTGSIGAQSALCTSKFGRVPNVVLVDFVDEAQVIQAQNTLNGL